MKPKDPPLTREQVAKRVTYDPETGVVRKIIRTPGYIPIGPQEGFVHHGYRWFGLYGRQVTAARIAWLMHYGTWPAHFIDHIDGNRLNNRIANLRQATRTQNNRNATLRADNTTGVRGVSIDKQCPLTPYKVEVGGKWIGHFRTLQEAAAAREAGARSEYGEFHAGKRDVSPCVIVDRYRRETTEIVFGQRMPNGYRVMWWSDAQKYGWEHSDGTKSQGFNDRWAARHDAFVHAGVPSRSKYTEDEAA